MSSLVTHHVWHTDWQNIWWTVIHCRMTSIRMIRWQVPIVHIWVGCGFFFSRALTLTSFFLMFDMKFKGPAEVVGDKIWLMSGEGEEGHLFLCFLLYPWVGSCNSASDSLLKIINANSSTHTHNSRIINQHIQPATQNWLQKSLQTPQKLLTNLESHQTRWHTIQHPWVSFICFILTSPGCGITRKCLYFFRVETGFEPIKTHWKKEKAEIICISEIFQLKPWFESLYLVDTGRKLEEGVVPEMYDEAVLLALWTLEKKEKGIN